MLMPLQSRHTCLSAHRELGVRSLPRRPISVRCTVETLSSVYDGFIEQAGATTCLQLRPSRFDNGLFTTVAASKGEVLMTVPKDICLVVDYENGLMLPSASWPRLQQGVNFREPLTWDILQALALIDGIAGDGGDFWLAYTQQMMPQPGQLTMPVCWRDELLMELQHDDIIDKAQQQQNRLRSLLPGLSRPIEEGEPSYLQWAFACVRSRAFRVGQDVFASIPFLDQANHAPQPNADFRPSADGQAFELVAVADVPEGSEVTISYTGPAGYTNQRLMAQYGFVPVGGNPADRLAELQVPEHLSETKLKLERVQDLLGDQLFMDAVMGKNAYMQAGLKSLPIEDQQTGIAADSVGAGAATGAEKELAEALLQQVSSWQEAAPTTLQQDEELLQKLEAPDYEADGRLIAAVQYRIERKKLLLAVRGVLKAYSRG